MPAVYFPLFNTKNTNMIMILMIGSLLEVVFLRAASNASGQQCKQAEIHMQWARLTTSPWLIPKALLLYFKDKMYPGYACGWLFT